MLYGIIVVVINVKIILRSASPRRKELLTNAGYSFEVIASDIDESLDANKSPYENVKKLGLDKAMFEADKYYGDILIGCDTIVVFNEKIYGKPVDEIDAYNTLRELSGTKHQVMSGVGIVYKDNIYNFVCVSEVFFKDLTDEDIWNYIKTGECFGKAGSYAIQGIGKCLIDKFEGSLENIIGLPIDEVKKIIGEIYGMED